MDAELEMMKTFWRWIVVVIAHNCVCLIRPLNYKLKNALNGKVNVMYVLPQ